MSDKTPSLRCRIKQLRANRKFRDVDIERILTALDVVKAIEDEEYRKEESYDDDKVAGFNACLEWMKGIANRENR